MDNDLTGRKFNKLTVLYKIPRKYGKKAWHCKCDCGNETDVLEYQLLTGRKKSCGCYRLEVNHSRKESLIGKRFGKLTVLEEIEKYKYRCKCDCGNEVIKTRRVLKGSKINLSCGKCSVYNNVDIDESFDDFINSSFKSVKNYGEAYYVDDKYIIRYFNSDSYTETCYKFINRDAFVKMKSMGKHLITVFDVSWKNNNSKVKKYIKSLVDSKQKIYARKCTVCKINENVAYEFEDMYHIQGHGVTKSIHYGLFYNNELVSVMSLGHLRMHKTEDGQWELHRYCVKDGYNILGGASKLFKSFIKDYTPKYVLSYSDNDYFLGNIYKIIGFKYIEQSRPRYYWYLNGVEFRRESCKLVRLKKRYPEYLEEAYKVCAENKEDYVMRDKLGAKKIYRSGTTKWVWKK